MRQVRPETVERLRNTYPRGARVKLIYMDDTQAPPAGTEGTVIGVDSLGTVHVIWDTSSTLGIAYGVDRCVKI